MNFGQATQTFLISNITDGDTVVVPPDVNSVQVSADATAVGSANVRAAAEPGAIVRIVGGAGGIRVNSTAFASIGYDNLMLSASSHVLGENDVLTLERVRKLVDGQSVLYWREVGLLQFERTRPVGKLYESVVTSPAAAFTALATTLPANSLILGAKMKFSGAITLVTAVKVGLGVSGNPDSILLSGTTMTDGTTTIGHPLTDEAYTAETTLRISACDTNGAAAGTLAGTVLVEVDFLEMRD